MRCTRSAQWRGFPPNKPPHPFLKRSFCNGVPGLLSNKGLDPGSAGYDTWVDYDARTYAATLLVGCESAKRRRTAIRSLYIESLQPSWMDRMMIDVSSTPNVQPGEVVTLSLTIPKVGEQFSPPWWIGSHR